MSLELNPPKKFYKILSYGKQPGTYVGYNNFLYSEGLNIDIHPFDISKSCCAGGLYYTEEKYLPHFLHIGDIITDVTIPDDAKTHEYTHGNHNKFKADKIIVTNFRPWQTCELFREKNFCNIIRKHKELYWQYINNTEVLRELMVYEYNWANLYKNEQFVELLQQYFLSVLEQTGTIQKEYKKIPIELFCDIRFQKLLDTIIITSYRLDLDDYYTKKLYINYIDYMSEPAKIELIRQYPSSIRLFDKQTLEMAREAYKTCKYQYISKEHVCAFSMIYPISFYPVRHVHTRYFKKRYENEAKDVMQKIRSLNDLEFVDVHELFNQVRKLWPLLKHQGDYIQSWLNLAMPNPVFGKAWVLQQLKDLCMCKT